MASASDRRSSKDRFILNTTNGQVMNWNPVRDNEMRRYRAGEWVECDANGTPLKSAQADNEMQKLRRELAEAKELLAAYQRTREAEAELEAVHKDLEENIDDIEMNRGDSIALAIAQMVDSRDADQFNKGGEPNVKVIEAIVGFDITSAERDEAWTAYLEQHGEVDVTFPEPAAE